MKYVLWLILFVLCWPLALLALVLWPVIWLLSIPLALLGIGVGVVGTVLAARLSDQAGAAFALTNHVVGMLFVLFRVVGAGVGVPEAPPAMNSSCSVYVEAA